MKDILTIGLPSKGRLKESALNFFKKNNFELVSKGGDRDYFASLDKLPNTKVIYLHAREIIERLGDGTLDIGISGLDLLSESAINLQKKIEITKKLDFAKANLVVCAWGCNYPGIPKWIDEMNYGLHYLELCKDGLTPKHPLGNLSNDLRPKYIEWYKGITN